MRKQVLPQLRASRVWEMAEHTDRCYPAGSMIVNVYAAENANESCGCC